MGEIVAARNQLGGDVRIATMRTANGIVGSSVSKSILVIFPGALGDLICLIPALRELARRHPGATLELMARAELARFATGRLGVGHGHSIDRRAMMQLFTRVIEIGSEAIEIGSEAQIYFSSFTHVYSFFAADDEHFRAALDTASGGRASYFSFRPAGEEHVAAGYLREIIGEMGVGAELGTKAGGGAAAAKAGGGAAAAAPIGGEDAAVPASEGAAELDCSFELRPEDIEVAEDRLARFGLEAGRYMLVLPGSGSPAKNWPAENFAAMALAPRIRSLVTLGPAEASLEPVFAAHRLPTISHLELAEVAALARLARCFVGNDSGVSHLAAASGAPGLAIFGPTDPARWRPLGRTTVLRREPLSALTPKEVEDALLEIIG